MTLYEWKPSASLRRILRLFRDGLCIGAIIEREQWETVAPIDHPPMRPEDREEVLRKLAELNREKPMTPEPVKLDGGNETC